MKGFSLLLATLLCLGQVPLFLFQVQPVAAQAGGYTLHDPILINGDENFTPANGVNGGGDGSESNPYIIENWVIEASSGHGICIRNTIAHFIIRNCVVENGRNRFYAGIYLENVKNGRIEDCTLDNNSGGIALHRSNNNTLSNNIMKNNEFGIFFLQGSNNTLSGNRIENSLMGIAITPGWVWNPPNKPYYEDSENNLLLGNKVENCQYGIILTYSKNCILSNNILFNNTKNFGFFGEQLSHFVHDINSTNLVNGRPILYLVGKNDIVIGRENEVAFLGLVNSKNVRVENLAVEGVLLAFVENSRVENVQCENGGVAFFFSSYNTLSGTTVENCKNQIYGIHLYCSNNNTLSGNRVKNCKGVTRGIYLEGSNNNTVSGNTVENCGVRGIYLAGSNNNTVSGNMVENCEDGIRLDHSDNNTLSGNLVKNCSEDGILLDRSNNNTLSGNLVKNCSEDGIDLWDSDNNILSWNFVENCWNGITLTSSKNCTLNNNVLSNNTHNFVFHGEHSMGTVLSVRPRSFRVMAGEVLEVVAALTTKDGTPISGRPIEWSSTAGRMEARDRSTDTMGEVRAKLFAPENVENELQVIVTAYFSGDENFWPAENISTGTVVPRTLPRTALKVAPASFNLGPGENVVLTARLTGEGGRRLAGRPIEWSASTGEVVPEAGLTDASGKVRATYLAPATVGVNLPVTVTASFPGDNKYGPSTDISGGAVLLPEVKDCLDNVESATGEVVSLQELEENLIFLRNAVIRGDVGAALKVGRTPELSVVLFLHENASARVREVRGRRAEVEVSSDRGRTFLLTIEKRVLPVLWEEVQVLVDNVRIEMAEDYADVLDPSNDNGRGEYLILRGARGVQVLVSIPHSSTRVITLSTLPPAKGVAYLVLVLVLLLVAVTPALWRCLPRRGTGPARRGKG